MNIHERIKAQKERCKSLESLLSTVMLNPDDYSESAKQLLLGKILLSNLTNRLLLGELERMQIKEGESKDRCIQLFGRFQRLPAVNPDDECVRRLEHAIIGGRLGKE